MSEPILWLPYSIPVSFAKPVAPPPPPRLQQWEIDCQRILALISEGCVNDAGDLAKATATYVYDHYLDRVLCEHTGYPYFHACYDDY